MSPTILLVEDDFVLRTALADFLERRGYQVACAANGIEAFHVLDAMRVKPVAILLDLMMPYMDGIEFRALQRSIPSMADVPVVVITASRHSAAEAELLAVAKTIDKPVNTTLLMEALDGLKPGARTSSPN